MPAQTPVNNFMAPATGTPNSVPVSGPFSATPLVVDFRENSIDGSPFVPQGLFADNTAGAAPLVIAIQGMNWSVVVPIGAQITAQYPAPIGQIVSITGNNAAGSVIFCDFPVLPSQIGGSAGGGGPVTIADGADVTLGAKADAPAANDTGSFSLMAFIKKMSASLTSMLTIWAAPATGTRTDVASATADTVILAANANRKGAVIFNDSTAILRLLLAAGTASATNRTVDLAAGANIVLNPGDYTGIIKGIWSAVNGNARVTEFS